MEWADNAAASRGRSSLSPQSAIRKVLIYRLGSLGDTVVALPCLHLLARTFPGAERVLLTNFPINSKAPAAAAVLDGSGLVQDYMRYTVGTRRVDELLRLASQVRCFAPDLLVYLMPLRPLGIVQRDRIFFRLAGVREIAGLPVARGGGSRRIDPVTGVYEAEAKRLARAIASLGDAHPEDSANWDMRLTEEEKLTALRALLPLAGRPLIVCAPGCKMQANDWEKENWRALLGRIHRSYPRYGLAVAGAQEDAGLCDFAAQDWLGPKLNLAGMLSPRQSAAVFAHATVFLGPDSGPKHLAACVGVPCVCVFGARDLPGVWFPPGDRNQIVYHQPECFGCGLETCIKMEKKCIRSVTVDEMEHAAGRVLGRAGIA
jgi:heptosyltransferase III